ncbi:unnamed protein product [Effrenium voratum]|uniref:J domain-containing protein n=1 Tax=Effrenium voratum TaxID=2562239 RepID=A0AA36MYK4_9DINO|nr:unnamed protein product [Effrenium voratum]
MLFSAFLSSLGAVLGREIKHAVPSDGVAGLRRRAIRQAYANCCREHHPDLNGGRESLEWMMIQRAYRILTDPEERVYYDSARIARNALSVTEGVAAFAWAAAQQMGAVVSDAAEAAQAAAQRLGGFGRFLQAESQAGAVCCLGCCLGRRPGLKEVQSSSGSPPSWTRRGQRAWKTPKRIGRRSVRGSGKAWRSCAKLGSGWRISRKEAAWTASESFLWRWCPLTSEQKGPEVGTFGLKVFGSLAHFTSADWLSFGTAD